MGLDSSNGRTRFSKPKILAALFGLSRCSVTSVWSGSTRRRVKSRDFSGNALNRSKPLKPWQGRVRGLRIESLPISPKPSKIVGHDTHVTRNSSYNNTSSDPHVGFRPRSTCRCIGLGVRKVWSGLKMWPGSGFPQVLCSSAVSQKQHNSRPVCGDSFQQKHCITHAIRKKRRAMVTMYRTNRWP